MTLPELALPGRIYEPLYSGLPSQERLVLELLKLRASVPDPGNGTCAALWAQDAVKKLSLRHSFERVTPYGDVELTSMSLEALNWLKDELEKAHNADPA